jgi:ABC-2 type transport system ATP-binding protein
MLKIQNLTKKFRGRKALDNLNVSFGEGIYGLLGPNGAGKTTLMRCITQLYPYREEAILYNEKCTKSDDDFLRDIGYLPQKFGLFKELTVYDALLLMGNLKGLEKQRLPQMIESALETVRLRDRAKSRMGTLSGGMVKRIGIAQALLGDPKILILDEPTAGLDPEERMRFKHLIASIKQGRTILISTHIVEDVESICNQIAIINKGKTIAEGDTGYIQSLAHGKVFRLPESEEDKIKGEYSIQRQYEEDGAVMLKILSDTPQAFPAAASTVEDGYVWALKNISPA